MSRTCKYKNIFIKNPHVLHFKDRICSNSCQTSCSISRSPANTKYTLNCKRRSGKPPGRMLLVQFIHVICFSSSIAQTAQEGLPPTLGQYSKEQTSRAFNHSTYHICIQLVITTRSTSMCICVYVLYM